MNGLKSTFLVASTLACVLAASAQQTTEPAITPTQATQTTGTAPAMSKSEMKAQRKQQKHQERSAKANAKAQKDQSKALKQQDKATNEQEKAKPQ